MKKFNVKVADRNFIVEAKDSAEAVQKVRRGLKDAGWSLKDVVYLEYNKTTRKFYLTQDGQNWTTSVGNPSTGVVQFSKYTLKDLNKLKKDLYNININARIGQSVQSALNAVKDEMPDEVVETLKEAGVSLKDSMCPVFPGTNMVPFDTQDMVWYIKGAIKLAQEGNIDKYRRFMENAERYYKELEKSLSAVPKYVSDLKAAMADAKKMLEDARRTSVTKV